MSTSSNRWRAPSLDDVAGNGLMNRRVLLGHGMALAGAIGAGAAGTVTGAAAEPLEDKPWSLEFGSTLPGVQTPSPFEKEVVRSLSNPTGEFRNSHARTPHHLLSGTVTPNGLHFSINHSGVPDIDPAQHKLVIHGMVRQPLEFTLETLSRYPLVTRMAFVECAGNSAPMFSSEPMQVTAQAIHGLVSNAEWSGVPLSTLLDEAGIDPRATWLIAEGADAQFLDRSVPVKKAYDDALIAIYQNGEHLMPGNGYPMRLLLPGYQGNMNVKYLRRIKAVDHPCAGGSLAWRQYQPEFGLSGVFYRGGGARRWQRTWSNSGARSWPIIPSILGFWRPSRQRQTGVNRCPPACTAVSRNSWATAATRQPWLKFRLIRQANSKSTAWSWHSTAATR